MATSKDAPTNSGDFVEIVTSAFKMYKESWEALKLNLGTFILAIIVPTGIIALGAIIFSMLALAGAYNGSLDNTGVSSASFIIGVLVLLASIVLALIFAPAIIITQLESVKGNKVGFAEMFEKSKKYVLRFIGLGILIGLIVQLPTLLLFMTFVLFPLGIAWAIAAAFFLLLSPYLLIDKDMGIVDSMKASVDSVKKNWKWVLAAYVVMIVIQLPSMIPFIGWIITLVLSVMYICLLPLIYVTKIKK